MTAAKHTPGPWVLDDGSVSLPCVEICEIDGLYGSISVYAPYASESDAERAYKEPSLDANLIAAAPEMLEALKALTSGRVSPATGGRIILECDIQAAERAVAKATGGAA